MNALNNKRGSQLVEASIAVPVLILTVMLMLRLFVFCMEILSDSIRAHENALEVSEQFHGAGISSYSTVEYTTLLKGGLLPFNAEKAIYIDMSLCNEDYLVRAGEVLEE